MRVVRWEGMAGGGGGQVRMGVPGAPHVGDTSAMTRLVLERCRGYPQMPCPAPKMANARRNPTRKRRALGCVKSPSAAFYHSCRVPAADALPSAKSETPAVNHDEYDRRSAAQIRLNAARKRVDAVPFVNCRLAEKRNARRNQHGTGGRSTAMNKNGNTAARQCAGAVPFVNFAGCQPARFVGAGAPRHFWTGGIGYGFNCLIAFSISPCVFRVSQLIVGEVGPLTTVFLRP